MRRPGVNIAQFLLLMPAMIAGASQAQASSQADTGQAILELRSQSLTPLAQGPENRSLQMDGLFFETAGGRVALPAQLTARQRSSRNNQAAEEIRMADGRVVRLSVLPEGNNFNIRLGAQPDGDIIKWGLAVEAGGDEYYHRI